MPGRLTRDIAEHPIDPAKAKAAGLDSVLELLYRNDAAGREPVRVVPVGEGAPKVPGLRVGTCGDLPWWGAAGSKFGVEMHGVLSPEECAAMIAWSEAAGYESLAAIYDPDYRNNTRVIITAQEVADRIWARIRHLVPRRYCSPAHGKQTLDAAADPDGSKGSVALLAPRSLNECFRFCKYTPGGHFNAHRDAHYRRDMREVSRLTFMIYLNDVGEEGATEFMGTSGSQLDVAYRVVPRAGMAVVFDHSLLHCGGEVESGLKYLMRSDVMYTDDLEAADAAFEAESPVDEADAATTAAAAASAKGASAGGVSGGAGGAGDVGGDAGDASGAGTAAGAAAGKPE